MSTKYFQNMNLSYHGAAYLAPVGFTHQLIDELKGIQMVHGRLIWTNQPPQPSNWAINLWVHPTLIKIQSINDGAKKLKSLQQNWCLYSHRLHRRAILIQEKLPHLSAKPLKFPVSLPKTQLGSWTLLNTNTILASAKCSSPLPNGEIQFVEDKSGPPNRAYLKLQEALTRMGTHPKKGQFCIDAGASPGGWTWVLAKLGAEIRAVDRSPLNPKIAALPQVEFFKGNAFSIRPDDFQDRKVEWLFCDVVCYPEKLFEWVQDWVKSGKCAHIVCTIKFQGRDPYTILPKFSNIPGGNILRLFHNKHELTWVYIKKKNFN